MNWPDIKLRWPYYILLAMTTFFIGFNTHFSEISLFILLTSLIVLTLRSATKFYLNIQKPWKLYLVLAVFIAIYIRLDSDKFADKAESYFFPFILPLYCLICIIILFLRNPKIYDSANIFIFAYSLLFFGSIGTNKIPLIYEIEVYLMVILTVFIAIKYAADAKHKFMLNRFLWFLGSIILIIITSKVFSINSPRIENYLNSFTRYGTTNNNNTMGISSLESKWGNKDALNTVHLRAYSKEQPTHLRISTFDTFKGNSWSNTIDGNEIKLDSQKKEDSYLTRLYNSDAPTFEKPNCTIYLSANAIGQILTTENTTWLKTKEPLVKMEANGFINSYSGRSGYGLYYTAKRSIEKSNILNFYQTNQLNLNKTESDYITSLSNSITNKSDAIATKVFKIHQYLIKNHQYDIKPKIPTGVNSIIYFLQNNSNAHCQYFSSSAVFLLRAQDIPCRVATGYLCFRYNSVGGYWVSKAIDAHAWVEYYDNGWQTFDPTQSAVITEETKKFFDTLDGLSDYTDYKIKLWGYQLISGEIKDYLNSIWDAFVNILLENINIVYFLALASLSYLLYVKFFKKRKINYFQFLLYSPINPNKKQIVNDYKKIIQSLKNKNIQVDEKDTIEIIINKIDISDLKPETKIQFINTLTTYQSNRFKPDSSLNTI